MIWWRSSGHNRNGGPRRRYKHEVTREAIFKSLKGGTLEVATG